MKLTRNKIRKIRKQQQQSVRKWKKARKSVRRRAATFRRSRVEIATDTDNNNNNTSYPLKLKNVFNKTLKRYIPLPVLSYLKERYQNMKRLRRKQRREKMIGGAAGDAEVAAAAAAAAAAASAAAASAAAAGAGPGVAGATAAGDAGPGVAGATAAGPGAAGPGAGAAAAGATAGADNNTPDSTSTGAGEKKPAFNLGPEIQGDISIHSESFVLEKKDHAQKLLTFLVKNGLPYYIQLELKPDGKKFNRHDTGIFDLRRILCGKFATEKDFETDGKIPDKKRDLYFKASDQVGIADGDTMGNEYPDDVFIYTGEKGQIDPSSTDKSIKIAIAGNNNGPVVVLDSRRLYKLTGGEPKSIDDFDTVLAFGEKVDPSEFRIQVAPMSEDDFKKAAATSSDGAKKGKKVIADDTNSYVVNLSVGCKVTSIQTLRKSLEMVRLSLKDEDDDSKTKAMDVFKMLVSLLNNPEFAKNEGFDDFKKKVVDFSYKVPGEEKKYGLAQLMTFFTETKGLPPALVKEFGNLMRLLGKGPMGENGACAAFDSPGLPIEFQTLVTPMADGKVKEVTRLTNKGNITGIAGLLEDLQGAAAGEKEGAAKKAEGAAVKAEGADAAKEGAVEGAAVKAEGAAVKAEGAAVESEKATEGDKGKEGTEGSTKEGAAAAVEGQMKTAEVAKEEGAEGATNEGAAAASASAAASAAAAAAASAAVAAANAKEHIDPATIPNPLKPIQEVIAINKLYEKYGDKAQKDANVKEILNLRKSSNAGLKKLVSLLLKIYTRSLESYNASNTKNPKSGYIDSEDYRKIKPELEQEFKNFKKSDSYKIIKDSNSYCDRIVSKFSPGWMMSIGEKRKLAENICTLFKKYVDIMEKFNESYEYFNHHKDMTPVVGAVLWGATRKDIEDSFNTSVGNLTFHTKTLEEEEKYTAELEQQFNQHNT